MKPRIGLIGDYILDIYVYGDCNRISPESPIPVFEQVRTEHFPGGSGNVERNLKALGAEVQHYHTSISDFSVKKRYVVNNQIVFRADDDVRLLAGYTDCSFHKDVEYVILSDYNKGFIADPSKIIKKLKRSGKKVVVDLKKPIRKYAGADIVKMNEKEFIQYTGSTNSYQTVRLDNLIDTLIVTKGPKGCIVINSKGEFTIGTEDHPVSDVTGAGDVFIAALTYYLACGKDVITAAEYATKLASISVTKFGTYVLSETDIRTISPKVVFTNGCFDILHRGHIEYLRKSRSLGDKLVVGINSDSSVRKLKGSKRPVNNQRDRKYMLESLEFVDEVHIFDEYTPYELIKRINPDIITKGGDYEVCNVVGNDIVDQVIILPFLENYSSTSILERI